MTVGSESEAHRGAGAREADGAQVIDHVEVAIAAGEFREAARLLEANLVEIAGWHLERLRAALDALPAQLVSKSPALSMAHRGAANFLDQDAPRAATQAAQQFAELGTSGNATGDRALVGIGEILALRSTRGFAAGLPIVERDRAHVEEARADWLEVPGELRSIVLLQWGLTRMLVQDVVGATRDFQEAYWAGRRSTMPHYARNGAEDAALMLALVDSVEPAEEWLGKARTIEPAAEHLRTYVEEWDPLVEAAVALARFELDTAREALARFRPAPDTNLSWSAEAYLRARLGLLSGERFGALEELTRVNHPRGGSAARGTLDEALLTLAEAELALAVGRPPRAEAALDRAAPGPLLTAVRARLALAKGDATGALVQSLAGLHESVPFGRVDLAAIAAVAQWRLGRRAEAAEQFGRALELARTHGVIAHFALLPRADLAALVELVPAGAQVLGRVLGAQDDTAFEHAQAVELSEREKLVLVELAGTASAQKIASRLFVSVNTVKTQVRSIYRKLGVHSREEALEVAHQWGFDLGRPER